MSLFVFVGYTFASALCFAIVGVILRAAFYAKPHPEAGQPQRSEDVWTEDILRDSEAGGARD